MNVTPLNSCHAIYARVNRRGWPILALAMLFSAQSAQTAPGGGIANPPSKKDNGKSMESQAIMSPADLHVAVGGDDRNNGTQEKPFASLEKARDCLRELRSAGKIPAGGVTVWIHGGTYMRERSFELGAGDGGQENAPVTYRAVPGERVRMVGGQVVSPGMLKRVSDPQMLARFPEESRGKVLELDLNGLGIKHAGPYPELFGTGNGGIFDVYFDGKRLGISRWPNAGYTTMKEVLDNGDTKTNRPGKFVYAGERPARWTKAVDRGLWLAGFWRVPWVIQTVKVKSIDPDGCVITQSVPIGSGIGSKYAATKDGLRKGDGKEAWYALNIPEELDLPGEWCIDFITKKFYLWPPAPIKPDSLMLSDMETPIISLKEAEYVHVVDLSIEGGLGTAVSIMGGKANLLAGCVVRNTGGLGVEVKGGHENGVLSCDLYNLGAHAISISGGERKTLAPSANYAVNNHIHHYGEVTKISNGIELSGVGNRVAHNLIHDGTYGGVQYRGNNHLMEHNEIHNIGLDGGDLGGFYSNGDWASAGNVIRYNFVHHAKGCEAFYMDDGHSSDEIYDNVVYETLCGPFIGGGHNHSVHNNLVFQTKKGIHVDDRGVSRRYDKNSRIHYGPFKEFAEGNPIYQQRYPAIERIPGGNPVCPTGNVIEDNVLVQCVNGVELYGARKNFEDVTVKDNLELSAEPGFVDAQEMDFKLKKDSNPQALEKLPWLNEQFPKIGLFKDAFRKSLPTAEETGRNAFRAPRQVFDSTKDVDASNQIEGKKNK